VEVLAVNRKRREALTDTDEVLPITNFLDADGEAGSDVATAAVAGPTADGEWLWIDLTQFEPRQAH
jgi:hypothetical protein